jgi:hypothetical protein
MLMGNGFTHKGWATSDYDSETSTYNYSGGPPWIAFTGETFPESEKETARFFAEIISEYLLSKIQDPKGNIPLIPLVYRTDMDTMGNITKAIANKIEDGLLQLKDGDNPTLSELKLHSAFKPMGIVIATWMATNTTMNFLINHVSISNVPTLNVLTGFGEASALGTSFGLALKQEGASRNIIASKVGSAMVKAFEDYFGSVIGTHTETSPNGTPILTNWTGLV